MGFFDKIKKGLEKTRRQMGGLFAEFTGENEEFYEELVLTLSIHRVSLSCGALKWHRRLNARPWTGNRQDVFGVMPVLWVKLL